MSSEHESVPTFDADQRPYTLASFDELKSRSGQDSNMANVCKSGSQFSGGSHRPLPHRLLADSDAMRRLSGKHVADDLSQKQNRVGSERVHRNRLPERRSPASSHQIDGFAPMSRLKRRSAGTLGSHGSQA
jgi:hypothetical protein